jgi:leader peptidase (prepilin peptidase)/N-methyltransferase
MNLLLAVLLGLVVGSFLNVCIYRIPRKENIVYPASHCPSCGQSIRPYDNIPLVSYLLLRGRCRSCGNRISCRYPVVEAATGLGFALLVGQFGVGVPTLLYFVFYSALVVLAFIDLEHQILPDVITLPGIPLGLLLALLPEVMASTGLPWAQTWPLLKPTLVSSAVGLAVGGGLFWLVAFLAEALLKREGMGGGDIKLAAMIGAFLGWKQLLLTILLATLSGSVVGILLLILGRKGREDPIPFGPFLSLGAFLSLLWGDLLIGWYAAFLR